jgi:hypothetical protein
MAVIQTTCGSTMPGFEAWSEILNPPTYSRLIGSHRPSIIAGLFECGSTHLRPRPHVQMPTPLFVVNRRPTPGCSDGRSSISFSRHLPWSAKWISLRCIAGIIEPQYFPQMVSVCSGPVYGSNRPQVEPVGSHHPRWRPIGFHQEATASAIRNVVCLIYEPRLERSPSSCQGGHHRIRPQRRECGSSWRCRDAYEK